ncbi:phenylpyruvate tautomerase PptA (4-oxalocrotonate tautomerase family) [Bradyrhizobium elkanii]|jgi:phenylpyruvate tautomerase PptA (4-oxalocrotonate tautomerase family)|uniref:tautomerase family protein n=1 Tax=Bradyrhizobium TaxID=374 RepID=UPI0008416536|nr:MULTISPECIES: tautomerase family protein [Bradyrhizobium]MCA1395843.1 tautomerase family protein [Bradyrhizobium sp. BRP56]ODM79717.1 4-oxalocrotonate tautomerase [Bradyrhizobium elkanii]ODM81526.1 4-oxalocrotonate tautomerase [Bradyrhizobium elkanii]
MSMISCDMRFGRSDEQKRALSAALLRVVSEATGERPDDIFFVIREGRGINFVEHGQHLPEFVEGAANDKELIAKLK